MTKSDWGSELLKARLRAGLTQSEVAFRAGISVKTVRHIERGQVQARRDTLSLLCAVLDYTPPVARITAENATSSSWEIRLMGPFTVLRSGMPVHLPRKQQTLLALLALQPERVVGHDEISRTLWGHRVSTEQTQLIYTYVARLRRTVSIKNDPLIGTVRNGYMLHSSAIDLDHRLFGIAIARASGVSAVDPNAAMGIYERSIRKWRGRFLRDIPDLWPHPAAVRIMRSQQAASLNFAELALRLGRPDRVVATLRHPMLDSPIHPSVQARLLLAHASIGRPETSATLLEHFRRNLRANAAPKEELAQARRVVAGIDQFKA
ncbi:winged helix-turn-helix domain-containing protein [Streptomyces sp. NPDC058739]|uniref:winged helix-turn-helix domain-containing protein n=1 Tax=Streptomyces sp. NPDC058739 TaxID=3346618 RepID=UPI0036B5177F